MEPYDAIAAYYDREHEDFQDDIMFYRQALPGGPVLEIGVGTGRIAAALLEADFEVWGIDTSPKMLERARERLGADSRIHLLHESIRTLDLDVRFKSIIFPHNTLWHLPSADDQVEALIVAGRHLEPDGLLVLAHSNPLNMADRGSRGELRQRFRHVLGEVTVVGTSAAWDDEAQQRLTLDLSFHETARDGMARVVNAELVLRYAYASELTLMLELAGFRLHYLYGSYTLDVYETESPALIALAGPRSSRASAR